MRRLCSVLVLLGLIATARTASALPTWMQDGKAGPFMFNLKIGPAINVYNDAFGPNCAFNAFCTVDTKFTLVLDFGFAVTPDRNGYLIFPLQFQVDRFFSYVMVPFGFQYDIKLPVKGLYLTPRLSIGYAAYIYRGGGTNNLGFIMPEFGVKFVFARRWNVGFDPFSLPIFFGDFTAVYYRLLFYGGVNF